MSVIEKVAVVALAVEVAVMVLARVGTERRHWNHYKKRGAEPHRRDDITHVSGILYGIAALAVAAAAFTVPLQLTLSTIGTFALFGVLLPALAANSVMVLATRGRPDQAPRWSQGLAFLVAAGGGVLSVGLAA
ncbi:hypothetical protein [Streptomyces sp. TRM64462]|uniref:hypothetical protein n=1 Tax=Streptomyces sp. TRM64462 TaxID=2741726 RepID=UPI0020C76B9D|nr:hypothetical protein [Streptomyces sp. TRM64462]